MRASLIALSISLWLGANLCIAPVRAADEADAGRPTGTSEVIEDADAVLAQAERLYLGAGDADSLTRAFELYTQLAAIDDPSGYLGLARMYLLGKGVRPDPERAIELFEIGATSGNYDLRDETYDIYCVPSSMTRKMLIARLRYFAEKVPVALSSPEYQRLLREQFPCY